MRVCLFFLFLKKKFFCRQIAATVELAAEAGAAVRPFLPRLKDKHKEFLIKKSIISPHTIQQT